jgi:hypothetical protein
VGATEGRGDRFTSIFGLGRLYFRCILHYSHLQAPTGKMFSWGGSKRYKLILSL